MRTSSLSRAYLFWILAPSLHMTVLLLTTSLNSFVLCLYRFCSHDILLLSCSFFPNIFPWRVGFKSFYLVSFLIICPRYSSFLYLIVFVVSFSVLICFQYSFDDILRILLYNYILIASSLLHKKCMLFSNCNCFWIRKTWNLTRVLFIRSVTALPIILNPWSQVNSRSICISKKLRKRSHKNYLRKQTTIANNIPEVVLYMFNLLITRS